MTTSEGLLRLDAKLASLARSGKTALVCFYVRGQDEELDRLSHLTDVDIILGVIAVREVVTADGSPSE